RKSRRGGPRKRPEPPQVLVLYNTKYFVLYWRHATAYSRYRLYLYLRFHRLDDPGRDRGLADPQRRFRTARPRRLHLGRAARTEIAFGRVQRNGQPACRIRRGWQEDRTKGERDRDRKSVVQGK